MSDTVTTIVQIAQLPMSAMILVGLYLLIVKLLPVILANSNKHTEAMTQMAQAITKVVDTGVGLQSATASLMETSKGFQASVATTVQMGEMLKVLIQQSDEERKQNADDHRRMIVLLRVNNKAVNELPCKLDPDFECPEPEGS